MHQLIDSGGGGSYGGSRGWGQQLLHIAEEDGVQRCGVQLHGLTKVLQDRRARIHMHH